MKSPIRQQIELLVAGYVEVGFDSLQIQEELAYGNMKLNLGDIEEMISVALGEQK